MTDLTKLTAEELLRGKTAEKGYEWISAETFEEIRHRLERLEKCEAFCETYADHLPGCACRISLANACDCGFIAADAARAMLEEKA